MNTTWITCILKKKWISGISFEQSCGSLPHQFIGKCPHNGKNKSMDCGYDHLATLGRQCQKDSGGQHKKEQKSVNKHRNRHHSIYIYMDTLIMAGFVVDNAGDIVAAENKLEVVIHTYLLVNDHTMAKTRA
jgi:hypothetical protein